MDELIEEVGVDLSVSARALTRAARSWSIAIFAARESAGTLNQAVCAALRASAVADIEVLVNGNHTLADAALQAAPRFPLGSGHRVRIWHIPQADKALTWNFY